MSYIEGFVAAVPTANKEKYRQQAEAAVANFKKLGATRLVECWGDDVPDGKVTDFKGAVQAKPDETIVFSWVEYPDRETRDAANEAMMNDPDAAAGIAEMPFDGKRMIFSGFAPILEAGTSEGTGYVDGFVIPVKVKKRGDYAQLAEMAAPIFMEHGALQVVETWGDDLMRGEITDFYRAVNAEEDEAVVFSWIAWPSREVRDSGNAATMADKRFDPGAPAGQPGSVPMPFEGQRMIFGGFTPIVDK